ncbi:MAG: hypothetical protein ACHQVS_00495 [Candidatus Babeliales bacterium]
MSGFDIKYDKNGMAIKGPEPVIEEAPVEAAPPEVEEVEAESESDDVDHVHEDEIIEEVVPQKPQVKLSSEQQNMRALREKAERAEREADRNAKERDEMMRLIQEMRAKNEPKLQLKKEEPEEDYSFSIGDDDLAEGKHLAKMQKHIKKLESELKSVKQQSTSMSVETRLKLQYPDIEKVLSNENIQRLGQEEPELAYTIGSNTDLYTQQVTAYKLIKKLGIYKDQTFDAEKEIIKKNAAKPRPVVSLSPQQGDSPLSRANAFANGLTEDLKKQLNREMHEATKNF